MSGSENMGKITARWMDLPSSITGNKFAARILLEKPIALVGDVAALISIGNNIMTTAICGNSSKYQLNKI